MGKYVISIDQGTTSSRAMIFDYNQNIVSVSQKEIKQIYPEEGFVEHDPREIWSTQIDVLENVIDESNIDVQDIVSIGITNQRETTIVWNKSTGIPVYNAIVWQCRRTAAICDTLKEKGLEEYIKANTGLVIDAYFSATKIKWILDNVPNARDEANRGELLFGTVDTWILWKLTNGKTHATDYTNASRTMLFNIKTLMWDERLLKELDIPMSMLPEVKESSGIFGYTTIKNTSIPIAGIAGDQQAALFGQCCFNEGDTKNTYGTGSFILMNTKKNIVESKNGLLTTIAIGYNGEVDYALEGSVFMAGAIIQWLRDELHLLSDAKDSSYFAESVSDSNGVYIVPAFVGLGAPYWDMYARGCIVGLTRGVNSRHIIRAAEEAIAFQSKDVIDAMLEDSGVYLKSLKVDGGASKDNFLMQFQADIIGKSVVRPKNTETTALGVAYLAGLATGFWKDKNDIVKHSEIDREFIPNMSEEERNQKYTCWKKAVERSKNWAT